MSEPNSDATHLKSPTLQQHVHSNICRANLSAIDALDTPYSGIAIDSRKVKPGDLFVAFPGESSDGRTYIPEALAAGAVAVLWDASGSVWNEDWDVPNLPIANLRSQLGHIADHFYKNPSRQLWVAGITGTNGKTSCSQWIAQSLTSLGTQCAVVGTLGAGLVKDLPQSEAIVNTTPDAVSLHAFLDATRIQGTRAVAMEVSSHGLEQGRVNGVAFDVAMFTNLTRDHLDYHGSMHSYQEAKARLFSWPNLKHAVVNLDDPFGAELASQIDKSQVNVIGYGLGKGEIAGHKLDLSARGLKLEIKTPWGVARISSSVIGAFNAHNILGVLGTLVCADVSLNEAVAAISELKPVPGRMQTVRKYGCPLVVVDYAHTPDALEKTLASLRDLLKPGARLHCVFGCGGDRDPGKRPLMGEVSTRLADTTVVTSDNPRSENSRSIIDQIVEGAHANYRVEPDRAAAILDAIRGAEVHDIVLIAGKGHETYQEIDEQRIPFNDLDVVRRSICRTAKKGGARV